ncbi:glycerate kinase [Thalassobius sp. MITS945101]|uniref:glycerate kinase type-2 family protein n=1 Tax=Thalassobius sp. MITS945101 TaxID=3096994 RepID=UPI00399AD153
MNHRAFLTELFDAAIAAADPKKAIAAHLPQKPKGRTVVIGAGKGAAQLAAAFEDLWGAPVEGTVITRYGYACDTRHVKVMEAAHPVPDAAGIAASEALFEQVQGLTEDDLVVALICGGGSALLAAPAAGLSFADEVALNEALLASGAPIGAMNAVRKQVSAIKGGRLAAACAPARVVSLVVSDVPGDDPAQVASGPTVPDAVGRAEALKAVADYGITMPPAIAAHLVDAPEDAPLPDDPRFARNEVHVIASAAISLEAAAAKAKAAGWPSVILSDAIEGEAREVAKMHGAMTREVVRRGRPFSAPLVMLSGGETTVTIRGKGGRGGRNSEFLLSLAMELDGVAGVTALAADTDGIDGSEDNAGAFADGGTVAAMRGAGVDPAQALAGNDAYTAFDAVREIFAPGPTGTNVNDFRAILIEA